MNASLSLGYAFGARPGGLLSFLSETEVIYCLGSVVVRYNLTTGAQSFCTPGASPILTASCLSPNKRTLALAGRDGTGKHPVITFYDLGTSSVVGSALLSAPVFAGREVVSISLSHDGKLFAALTGAPDFALAIGSAHSGRVVCVRSGVGSLAAPTLKVSFVPGSSDHLVTVGSGPAMLMVLTEQQELVDLERIGDFRASCAAWTDHGAVIGTTDGRLASFGASEGSREVTDLPRPSTPAEALCGVGSTLYAVCAGLRLVTYSYMDGAWAHLSEIALAPPVLDVQTTALASLQRGTGQATASTLAVHPSSGLLAMTTSVGAVLAFDSRGREVAPCGAAVRGYEAMVDAEDTGGDLKCFHLVPPAHNGAITALSAAVRKPLVLAASAARTASVYDYLTGKTVLNETFPDAVLCGAMHPSGLFCVLGFADRLRVYAITPGGLAPAHEFAHKHARAVCYSAGGHLMAAACGTTVHIIRTTTGEAIAALRGHSSRVASLSFVAGDDDRLVVASADGSLTAWQISSRARELEAADKSAGLVHVSAGREGSFFAVASDGAVRSYSYEGAHAVYTPSSSAHVTAVLGALCPCAPLPDAGGIAPTASFVFLGTDNGSGQLVLLPLSPLAQRGVQSVDAVLKPPAWQSALFDSPLTAACVAHGGRVLVVGSATGDVIALDVSVGAQSSVVGCGIGVDGIAAGRIAVDAGFTRQVLVDATELAEREQLVAELRASVEEAKEQAAYQLRLEKTAALERLQAAEVRESESVAEAGERIKELEARALRAQAEHDEEIRSLETEHQRNVAAIEAKFETCLAASVDRAHQLEAATEEVKEEHERQLARLADGHLKVIAELSEGYEGRLQEVALLLERSVSERDASHAEAVELQRQVAEDADEELADFRAKYEALLTEERESALRLKGENGVLRKKFSLLQQSVDTQKAEVSALTLRSAELTTKLNATTRDLETARREVAERDAAVREKEQRLHEIRKQNQELEKFRYVLSFKVRELQRQVDPREAELAALKTKLSGMEAELRRYGTLRSELELAAGGLRSRLDAKTKESTDEAVQRARLETKLERVYAAIEHAVSLAQRPKELLNAVLEIHRSAGGEVPEITTAPHEAGGVPSTAMAAKVRELDRQRLHLEQALAAAHRLVAQERRMRKVDVQRAIDQNVELVREINLLRRDGEVRQTRNNQRVEPIRRRSPSAKETRPASTRTSLSRGRPLSGAPAALPEV